MDVQFRRMRCKCQNKDFSSESWLNDRIGVWYGGWSAREFDALKKEHADDKSLAKQLTAVNDRQGLRWSVSQSMMKTVWKFWDLRPNLDWVFTQFDGRIHIAQLADACVSGYKSCDWEGEVFKSRKITNKRSFKISNLPDCFRLLASAGRANCHEVHGTRPMIELLSHCKDESAVWKKWKAMPLEMLLEIMGPKSWEATCEAYLILEEQFLPLGLGVGRTLPVFDLVGKSQKGQHIYAQCKGNRELATISSEFLDQSRQISPAKRKTFFFAYAGVTNRAEEIKDVIVIRNAEILGWLEKSKKGKTYLKLVKDS